jgi:hypothetical protein
MGLYLEQKTTLSTALTAVKRYSSESTANWFISIGITGYIFASSSLAHQATVGRNLGVYTTLGRSAAAVKCGPRNKDPLPVHA